MYSDDELRDHDDDNVPVPAPSKRRQNRSCDHCRSGKRRCDVRYKPGDSSPPPPCSNCKKWKKACTIEWIKARERNPPPRTSHRQRRQSSAKDGDCVPESRLWSVPSTRTKSPDSYEPRIPLSISPLDDHTSYAFSVSSAHDSVIHEELARQTIEKEIQLFSPTETMLPCYPEYDELEQTNGVHHPADQNERGSSTVSKGRSKPKNSHTAAPETDEPQTNLCAIRNVFLRPPSPFSMQFLADDYNRLHVNQSLLKIYHDSLEGALSCWLTERNCPYSFSSFDGRDTWGSRWASRMVLRVCALDNEYSKAGLLSKMDHKEGSKVLNMVVLAFAAQWTQAGERFDAQPVRRSPPTPSDRSRNGTENGASTAQFLDEESFGRNAQKALWHQANRALRAASENTSFQAIFAGIIFSLTQRPIDSTEVLDQLSTAEQDELASLFNVLDIDGPTVTLDTALRKLHDHQRRLQGARHPGVYGAKAPQRLSSDHMETFGLLYWLAVMFDTLSAAMNRRSFTISDADTSVSRLERKLASGESALYRGHEGPVGTADDADVWGDYFLKDLSYVGHVRKSRARWPCDYIDAASCLADAAPVKVLLYRRLGNLQSLFYQRAPAQQIEDALEAAMEVYNHWNSTYALFIEDCINSHEDLPPRIQSWYTLLCGHWNLAVLMLLDLIDTLDNAEMTMPSHRVLRQQIHFTGPLRETAVAAISELGRCCCSEEPLAFSQSPDFHRAVNKAALLTEPWTVVLVRAYGYAGAILANRVRSEIYEVADLDLNRAAETRERLRYCIEGLHLLGKKSDMALCAAELLSRAANT